VTNIIRRDPDLKALHLSLDTRRRVYASESHSETRRKALEHIGYAITRLESLNLEGDLHFTDKAWTTWAAASVWGTLQTLSIIGTPLFKEMTSRLQGQLLTLKTLTLSAYEDYQSFPKSTFHESFTQVKTFLSSLKLTRLCLLGFHPEVLLHALPINGASLRYLRFHVRENAWDLRLVLGPSYSTLLLSALHLETLRSTCSTLEWLGLDVCRSDLIDEEPYNAALSTDCSSTRPYQSFHSSQPWLVYPHSGTYASSCIMSRRILGPCPPAL